MTNRGLYIVIEGAEGVGKTTQVELLATKLREQGRMVRIAREPDSQSELTARAIRHLTQDPRYPMNTRTEVLLYNAARSQSLEVIRNARAAGVICLCDRNYLTTLAIQYYGRGDVPDYGTINSIINFAVADMQPDITIILDGSAQMLHERAKGRGAGERCARVHPHADRWCEGRREIESTPAPVSRPNSYKGGIRCRKVLLRARNRRASIVRIVRHGIWV